MKIKTLVLVCLLSIGFPLAAKAETGTESNNIDPCNAECAQLNVSPTNSFPLQLAEDENEVAQRTRIRRTRRGEDLKKVYLGGTLGLFFPSDLDDGLNIDLGTSFGGSLYAGYKFNSFIGADVELLSFLGGAEVPGTDSFDDSAYITFGIFANPRFTFVFNRDNVNKSPYIFLSPGLGFNVVGFTGDIADEFDDFDTDTAGAGLALQLKAGLGFPLSEIIDIFGQVRYLKTFNIYTESDDDLSDDQDFSSLGLELGLNFKI